MNILITVTLIDEDSCEVQNVIVRQLICANPYSIPRELAQLENQLITTLFPDYEPD